VIVSSPYKEAPILVPQRVDGVLDAVGGDLFACCVTALRPGGTLSLVGAVGGSNVRFDAYELIRPVMLTGYSSETLDGQALRKAVATLANWLVDGRIKAPSTPRNAFGRSGWSARLDGAKRLYRSSASCSVVHSLSSAGG
jgi:NADPH:quinone reductase